MGNLLSLCFARGRSAPRELVEISRLDDTKEIVERWVAGLEREARRLRQQAKAHVTLGSSVMAKQCLKAALARERLAAKQAECIGKLDLMRLSLEGLVGARDILSTLSSGSKAALDIQKQLDGFDRILEQVEDSVEQATATMTELASSDRVESAAGLAFDPDELEAELASLIASERAGEEDAAHRPPPESAKVLETLPVVPDTEPIKVPPRPGAKRTAEGVLI